MATGDLLSICNRSLLAVGARSQISSVSPSDGSAEANALSVLFTPTFESLARTAHWNCLRKQVVLPLLAAASGTPENPQGTSLPLPPTPWLYAYAYPADCLAMIYLVPSFPSSTGSTPQTTINNAAATWLPSGGQIVFQVTTYQLTPQSSPVTVILTNQEFAQAAYTANLPNPAQWDSLFQAAMVSSLGAFLVPALSLSLPLMQMCIKQAETAIGKAQAMDGNEGVTSMDHTPDWMQARRGGSGYGYGGYGGFNQGWISMNWPSGGGLDGSYG